MESMYTLEKHWQEAARNAGKSLPKALVDMTLEEFPSLLNTRKQVHLRSDTTISSCSSEDHEYKPISITNYLNVDSLDYVMIFVAWLYLDCGISQAWCREVVDYILYLIKNCCDLPPNVEMEHKIPKDVRTITKQLKLHPILDLQFCCQKCYSLYDLQSSFECGYQATPQSPTQLPHGTNPSSVFVQQEFNNWIKWFLSLPEVEASFEEGCAQPSHPEIITNYLHSRACKKIAGLPRQQGSKNAPLNQFFSMFQVSLAVMALTFLNLHPSIQYKPQYTFLAGIIPAPNQPDMVTISNVMQPIVDELLNLERSIQVKTYRFPEGRSVIAKLGALI
ncbi:hypothetical protein VP01_3185g3, partial [Puccinia sorghi]